DVSEAYLAALFKQSNRNVSVKHQNKDVTEVVAYKDMRTSFINASNLRNDIELFSFNDESKQFGENGAEIYSVRLEDQNGEPLS
ncbi:hypothetical protein, partial [Klebsiella pneumoniae]